MIKLSENTLSKLELDDAEMNYINSRAFDLKRHLKKTQKRTGLSRFEISLIVANGMRKERPSKTYLDKLTSLDRFKKKGDLYKTQHEKIVQIMTCITNRIVL